MKMKDEVSDLEQDHQRFAENLAHLVAAENASDDALVRHEWDALESGVLRHLDCEEMFLLPGFEKEQPAEAAAIRDQHARIRSIFGEIGIALDLHLLGSERVTELRDLLLSHVDLERRSLYVWARSKADEPTLRALLRRRARDQDAASSALASILTACEDGERGYSTAASDVDVEGFKLMFRHYADERAGFAKALHDIASRAAVTPPGEGSVRGALHRRWIDLKAAIDSGNPRAVLIECRRGEDAALRAYRDALRADLAPPVRELIQEQYEAIRRARAEIVALVE